MRTRIIADSIARWTLILLIGLLPFFVIPVPWAAAAQAKMLLVVVLVPFALLCWCIGRLAEGAIFLPRSFLLAAGAALPIAYLISALASHATAASYVSGDGTQNTVASVAILFGVLLLFALVFGAPSAQGEQHAARRVAKPLRALLGGGALLLFVQIVRLSAPSWLGFGGALSGSASSLVGSWHDLGIFAGLVVFFSAILWSSPSVVRGVYRAGLMLLGLSAFLLLIVIGIADVWYVLAAVLLTVAVCQWGNARLRERRPQSDALLRAAVAFVVGALALVCAIGNGPIAAHLPERLRIVNVEVRPSWQGTFAVGQNVFKGPELIFGSGPNTFMQLWGQFKPAAVNQTQFWSMDFQNGVGVIPTSLITIGLLGTAAWLALLLALLMRAWRVLVRERLSPSRSLPAALAGGTLFLGVFHVLYTPGAALSLMLFGMLGLSAALAASEEGGAFWRIRLGVYPRAGSVRTIAAAFVVVVLGFACVYTLRATVSDMLVAKAVSDYSHDGDIGRARTLIEQALRWYPQNDAGHRAAVELGLLQMQQMVASGESGDATGLQAALSQTISEGLTAVSINSSDYQNWLALAQLYQSLGGVGVGGAYQNALSAYQKAAIANPTSPLPLIGAAQTEAGLKDATSSIAYIGRAIALKPDLAAGYYLRSQMEAGQGDFVNAIQDAERAVSLTPQDPLGWYNLGAVLYSSGDYATAVQALRQAVVLNNTYANALFVLSLALDKTGDKTDAVLAMQQVVTLNPNNATASQALKNLEAEKPALSPPAPTHTNSK